MNLHDRLLCLRKAMLRNGVDCYIIPSADPHIGEYIPDHWKIIEWLTGFSGSSATVVVTDSFAGLWTDSRYYVQAGLQLEGSGFGLMIPDQPSSGYIGWIAENLPAGSRIGFDGRIMTITGYRRLEKELRGKRPEFSTECDLIDDLWNDRPPMPFSTAWDHPLEYSGKERSEKIAMVRKEMESKGADWHLLTSVDDIMWLLNIRGNDLQYIPLCFCYALAGREEIFLFVGRKKISEEMASDFEKLNIRIEAYENIKTMISSIEKTGSILITPAMTSVSLFNSVPSCLRIVEDISIPSRLKAVKNKTEIENISRTMIKDGVLMTRFLLWLEEGRGDLPVTEFSLARKLNEIRSGQEGYIGPSFSTIVAYNEHSAMPHYSPPSENSSPIGESGILLVDSGGQYMGGTTDITRTISLGSPTIQQKKDFTLILKGHIALAKAKFPHGTRGYQLDILARKTLWEKGLNYGHGTGHGVGYCLNVHEGPQTISPSDNKTVIEAGMIISNEPALYRPGEYGIRTENIVLCYDDEETEFGHFLKFDTISLCCLDRSLIEKSLLDDDEEEWINRYHSEVYEKLSPHLSEEERAWLRQKTDPL